jgi:regulator of cell morphogenesis and NO signaling
MTDVQDRSLGDLVTANPAAARVLERHGLDYCCHGRRSLGDACADAGIDTAIVTAELSTIDVSDDTTWTSLDPPELTDVRQVVTELRAELEPHLLKEERVLFPAIAALAAGQTEFPFGPVERPIHMMVIEHDRAGELLARLRAASDGYQVPDDGCASYRSLYGRLAALELDTHVHIHKENHVLFPAALDLAER